MKAQELNTLSEAIERMSLKASLLMKARSLKLSEFQMNVYRKVLNNEEIGGGSEFRSIDSLIRKGLIKSKNNFSKCGECSCEVTNN